MSREQDAGAAMARAWRAIEDALVNGDPWRVTAADVGVIESTFSSRCQRLDEDESALVDEAVRTLEVTQTIDPSRLDAEDRELAGIPGLMAAAQLLARRAFMHAGARTGIAVSN